MENDEQIENEMTSLGGIVKYNGWTLVHFSRGIALAYDNKTGNYLGRVDLPRTTRAEYGRLTLSKMLDTIQDSKQNS